MTLSVGNPVTSKYYNLFLGPCDFVKLEEKLLFGVWNTAVLSLWQFFFFNF
jgi:hypothetical protein